MTRRFPVAPQSQFQGQIFLEQALFCVGCELIFTAAPGCPRCSSADTLWPLADWLRSTRSSTTALGAQPHPRIDALPGPHSERTPSAA